MCVRANTYVWELHTVEHMGLILALKQQMAHQVGQKFGMRKQGTSIAIYMEKVGTWNYISQKLAPLTFFLRIMSVFHGSQIFTNCLTKFIGQVMLALFYLVLFSMIQKFTKTFQDSKFWHFGVSKQLYFQVDLEFIKCTSKQSSQFLMKLSSSRNGENEESLFIFLGEWGNGE